MAELSYPNINFQESIVGPAPVRRPWRDRIGVVGEFSRGPTFPVRVSSREEIVRIFGENNGAASLQIQDAQLLGANNFSICRAVPDSAPSTASFLLAAGNPDLEPVTGYESSGNSTNVVPDAANYTVGLNLELNYIGSPIVISPIYGSVTTAATEVDHANFSGRGNLRVHVIDCVDAGDDTDPIYDDTAKVIAAKVATTVADEYQYIFISKTNGTGNDINYVADYLVPGYVLGFTTGNGTERMLIVSPVIDYSATEWAILVKTVVATTSGLLEDLQVFRPATASYIMGYALELVDSTSFSAKTSGQSYFTLANQTTSDGTSSYSIDNYFALPVAQSANNYINFVYHTVPTAGFGGPTAGTKVLQEDFGSAGSGKGIQILYGTTGSTNIPLLKAGAVRISFANDSVTVGATTAAGTGSYAKGTSAATILRDLERAILTNTTISALVESGDPQLIVPPYGFTMTSRILGTEADRISYTVTRYVEGLEGSSTDINLVAPNSYGTSAKFTDGFDGPAFASRDFYALNSEPLLRVIAVSPGSYGNQLEVTIVPETSSGTSAIYELVVTDLNANGSEAERWRLDNAEIASDGLYLSTQASKLIRAYFLPRAFTPASLPVTDQQYTLQPLRSAPALGLQASAFATGVTGVSAQAGSFIRSVLLQGAYDFRPTTLSQTETRKRGYIAALEQMKSEDIAYLLLPGLTYGNTAFQEVFEAAIDQVTNARVENGLRSALFDAPIGISARQLAPLTAGINNERVRLVVGHTTSRNFNGRVFPQVGSSGKMAGLLAVRAPHVSVASTYGGYLLDNVFFADTKNDPEYLNTITNAHADVLFFDSGLGGYKFLNGITTSYDSNRRYGSVRAVMDQIISDLYVSLQWVRSEPNTRELQRRVSAAIDARLQQGLRNGSLIRVNPCICGRENNSEADMIAGILNISIRVTPVFPADFIRVNVVRDLTENLSLQTASGVSAF